VGDGLDEFFAAARVLASNFVICAAVEPAILSASPSAASCATRPTACARAALTLRPVRSRSRTNALPRSRLRRGCRRSGDQAEAQLGECEAGHFVSDDDVARQGQLETAAKQMPWTAAMVTNGAASMALSARGFLEELTPPARRSSCESGSAAR